MSRPEGYRQALAETCFLLLIKWGPYGSPLLLATVGGAIASLLIATLLLFVVECSPDALATIAGCLDRLPLSWLAPLLECKDRGLAALWLALPESPSLAPSFQRPPPLFS